MSTTTPDDVKRAPRANTPRQFVGFRIANTGVQYIDHMATTWSCNRSEAIRRILADHARRNHKSTP